MVNDEGFPLDIEIDGVTTTATPAEFNRFARTYERLGDKGWCDTFGYAESERVWEQWLECGKPEDVAGFIRDLANAPPYIDPNITVDTTLPERLLPWGSVLAKWKALSQP